MRAGDCEACSGDWLRGIRASKKLDASCDACPGIQIQRLGCECDSVADTALDVPVTTQLDAANAQPGLAADEADNSVEFAHNTAAPSATTAGATAELPAAAPDAAGAAVTLPDTGKL